MSAAFAASSVKSVHRSGKGKPARKPMRLWHPTGDSPLQAKLKMSHPTDRLEIEADRVAAQVMRMPTQDQQDASGPQISSVGRSATTQRLCEGCEDEIQRQTDPDEEEMLQAKRYSETPGVTPDLESDIKSVGNGHPLSVSDRNFFEPRFRQDLTDVRLHTDNAAAGTARSLGARAFTMGSGIYFGESQYQPHTNGGRELLAHELTHVIQQRGGSQQSPSTPTQPGANTASHVSASPATETVQRACGPRQIGAPVCTGESSEPIGELALFAVNCDTYATPADEQIVKDFADSMTATDSVTVHGFASVDGSADFNQKLSCARARTAEATLLAAGVQQSQIEVRAHGPTPGPATQRRSVVLERNPGVSRLPTPQLTVTVTTLNPGTCGNMNFVVRWGITRNSTANGGFVIQDLTINWNEVDCTGNPVPDPAGHVSPLRYFEAWEVLPNSTNFSGTDGNTDTFAWAPGTACSVDTVTFTGVATYHDDVVALPATMTRSNANTKAGTLRSSLGNPNLGGNLSRPLDHNLRFRWDCCPCQSSPTVVVSHTP